MSTLSDPFVPRRAWIFHLQNEQSNGYLTVKLDRIKCGLEMLA